MFRSTAIWQPSIDHTRIFIGNLMVIVHQTLTLQPSLCCSSHALCITFAGWPVRPSWWWFRGAHSCAGIGLEGTCSGTWIRLFHHPVLPASRLLSRVPEMGCQGHRASCLSCWFSHRPWRGNRQATVLILNKERRLQRTIDPPSPISTTCLLSWQLKRV